MTSTVLLLLQLLPLVSASHHFGGTVSFSYKGTNPDGSYKVSFRSRATFDECQYHHSWLCDSDSDNCGHTDGGRKTVIDRSGSNSEWCETETVETRTVRSDKSFDLLADDCCWTKTRNGLSNWRLKTGVDLGRRSDTGKPNSSPVTAILPFIRIPENCFRSYKLMSFDPDGDKVRCRYGNYNDRECRRCDRPSGFHLDEDSCTFSYEHCSEDPDVYGFELVVEDYSREQVDLVYLDGSKSHRHPGQERKRRHANNPESANATTTTSALGLHNNKNASPFSKLPLEFSFRVDPAVPSCKEGDYLPKFVHPTPEDGARIKAEVNKEVEIRVKAEAFKSTIQDLIMSGPSNVTKHKTIDDEFVIRWTPTEDDLGDYYPICFAVESTTKPASSDSEKSSHSHSDEATLSQSGVYQSEMRCVLLIVVTDTVKANVVCGESSMRVEISRDSLSGLSEEHLELSDPDNTVCNLTTHSNSSHIIADIPLNACGTQIEEDEDNLIFKNEITTVDGLRQLITRKHNMEVSFFCQYRKKNKVMAAFTAHRKNIIVWEKGFGTFTYQFEFYTDNQFQNMFDPNSYPLEYDLGSKIYMQIDASSSVNNTVMFVESCRASPYDNRNYNFIYTIIDNGCAVDPTVQIYPPSNQKQFRFSMEAFKYIGLHDQVYISCSVIMCEAGKSNTRCSQGCKKSSRSDVNHHIHKREAAIESKAHFISQGPLRLHSDNNPSGMNLNMVFIAGCLLAAVGMICGVAFFKTMRSKVRPRPLSAFES